MHSANAWWFDERTKPFSVRLAQPHAQREGKLTKADSPPTESEPGSPRRGWLKRGNRVGDFKSAPRCGARTRRGTACQCPALRGRRRCRLHGGRSTGPRTPEGLRRIRKAATQHGRYSREQVALKRHVREFTTEGAAQRPSVRHSRRVPDRSSFTGRDAANDNPGEGGTTPHRARGFGNGKPSGHEL